MDTVANLKEQAITQTPLLLFDVVLPDGGEEHGEVEGLHRGASVGALIAWVVHR